METGGLEEKREEGREADDSGAGSWRASWKDSCTPPPLRARAHGSALTGAWCLSCLDAGTQEHCQA